MENRSLSPSELARLEQGLPSLATWSEEILVPFEARKLKDASVSWLNQRWFLERDFDLGDQALRQRIEGWLCDHFAFATPREEDSPNAYTSQVRTLHADRYGGSSSINRHGGSGRAASIGRFHVKGVGPTPLTGIHCGWVHSHGCMSMEEAIREAIYSEIAVAEFPFGAVPVIAIIDAGLCYSRPEPEIAEEARMRRALVVRPAFVRPAHAERAPRFLSSQVGYANSQVADTRRCKDVVVAWLERTGRDGDASSCDIASLIERVATQAAFGQVHRLFNGGFFSSNVTIDGALVDFGGMRPQRNWANARMTQFTPGFGDEMDFMRGLVSSLVFHFKKFGGPAALSLSEPALLQSAQDALEQAFARECANLFGLDACCNLREALAVADLLRHYFLAQQTSKINYATRHTAPAPWLYDVLNGTRSVQGDESPEHALYHAIDAVLKASHAQDHAIDRLRDHAWITAMRCLKPRSSLERDLLQNRTFALISAGGAGSLPNASAVDAWIHRMVGEGRRHWPNLPRHLSVTAHVYADGSSALLCVDARNGDEHIWLEGTRTDTQYRLFDNRIPPEALRELTLHHSDRRWSASVPGALLDQESMCLALPPCVLSIPPFQAVYTRPAHCVGARVSGSTASRDVPARTLPQVSRNETA